MTMAFYGLKDAPTYEFFVDTYISCNVSLLPITLPNAKQHQHIETTKKKFMLFVDSIIYYLL
jgi:hypothetical protein